MLIYRSVSSFGDSSNVQGYFQVPPNNGTPENGKFPIRASHIFMDSYGSGMGIIWETSHKGVPLLGVPENPTEMTLLTFFRYQVNLSSVQVDLGTFHYADW